jgi:hypothetical protein
MGAMSLASGIYSASQANRQAKRQQALMESTRKRYQSQHDENMGRINEELNKNALDRSENRQALTEAGEALREQNQAVARQGAITGATSAAQSQARAANAKGYSNLVSAIAARGSAQKDALRNEIYSAQGAYNQGMGLADNAQNSSYQNSINQYGNALSNSVSSFGSSLGSLANSLATPTPGAYNWVDAWNKGKLLMAQHPMPTVPTI